jgi:hypothetical protein
MKSKILLLGAVVTAFTYTSFAAEPLLSPRAKDNQIKVVASSINTQASTASYVASASPALLSPRATGNQIAKIAGTDSDFNPALACRNGMAGSPKVVAECSIHTTMPGCQTIALK